MVMYTVYSQYFTSTKQLNIGLTAIFSVCLWASSITMIVAERFLKKDNKRMFVTWLVITIILGAIFIGGQGHEYYDLWTHHYGLSTGPSLGAQVFGTVFFVLTGFHGFHVFVGLVLLIIMLCDEQALERQEGSPGHCDLVLLALRRLDLVVDLRLGLRQAADHGSLR